MKTKVLAISILVLAILSCISTTLPTLTPTPLASPTILPTLTPVKAITVVSSERPCARVTATSLHVRYGADYYSNIMGWFVQDTLVSVRREVGDWWVVYGYGIDFRGRKTHMTGFVKSDYLELCPCYVQSEFKSQRR